MLVPFGAAAAAGSDLSSAFAATITYLLIYAGMTLGAFGVVIAVSQRIGSTELKDWTGLFTYAPGLAGLLAIFFLSLAGIPPLAGWFAKLVMFSSAIAVDDAWGYSIAVIAALNSVVAFVYYAKVVKVTFFDPVPETVDAGRRLEVAPTVKLALALTAATVIVFGIFPSLITDLVDLTTEALATGF
jgi:NADH-quinone oxidoreductase subunit N